MCESIPAASIPPRANMVYKRTQHVVSNMLAQHVAFVWTGLKGKTSVIKLSVSIFGQTAVCRIYTVSREPIRLPEIQWYLITLVKVLANERNMCQHVGHNTLGCVAWCWHMLRPVWNQSNFLPNICQHFFCSPVTDEPGRCIPTWSDCIL